MGADGGLIIYDASKLEEAGLLDDVYEYFQNVRTYTIFDRQVLFVYWDTENHDLKSDSYKGEKIKDDYDLDQFQVGIYELWS
jgi:hypothetical protein